MLNELDFQSVCNLGMVELEPVVSDEDKRATADMITSFPLYRQPERQAYSRWLGIAILPKFVKVMPIDYKRVLAERKAAAAKVQSR